LKQGILLFVLYVPWQAMVSFEVRGISGNHGTTEVGRDLWRSSHQLTRQWWPPPPSLSWLMVHGHSMRKKELKKPPTSEMLRVKKTLWNESLSTSNLTF